MTNKQFLAVAMVTATASVGSTICTIWAFIEFCIYLFKDSDFNWNSIWFLIGCILVAISGTIIKFVEMNKLRKKVNQDITKLWSK